jgi:hypothetical protein
VIPDEHVNLPGKLAFECRQKVNQLVGLVSTRWIKERAMDQFLKDYMSIRMRAQVCPLKKPAKILDVSVQIAGDKNILRSGEMNQVADTPRRVVESTCRLTQRLE